MAVALSTVRWQEEKGIDSERWGFLSRASGRATTTRRDWKV